MPDLLDYSLFVTFFPLCCRADLRFHEIRPQLSAARRGPSTAEDLAVGLTIFIIGLVKKTILADGHSAYTDRRFRAAPAGTDPSVPAWGGAAAYACQLYFEFPVIPTWRSSPSRAALGSPPRHFSAIQGD